MRLYTSLLAAETAGRCRLGASWALDTSQRPEWGVAGMEGFVWFTLQEDQPTRANLGHQS